MADINVTVNNSDSYYDVTVSAEPVIADVSIENNNPVVDVEIIGTGPQGEQGPPGADGADGAPGQDGVSPEVTVSAISGGHSVTITDADHPAGQTFNVMDGQDGAPGQDGTDGADGAPGQNGAPGARGGIFIRTATAPSEWNNTIDGYHAYFRMAIATILSEGQVSSVAAGDIVAASYYHYPVIYVDSTYAYFDPRNTVRGPTGATGTAAGFGTPTASVDANVGTPSVSVTASGSDTSKVFAFAFTNLKGEPGTDGVGVPAGGTDGQVLVKDGATDYQTKWGHDYQTRSTFSATRSSSFNTGALYGSYDPFTHTVRIWLWCTATANVASSVALFTGIPEEYRPSSTVQGAGFGLSGSPTYFPMHVDANANGSITQGATNGFRGCFGYIEYGI